MSFNSSCSKAEKLTADGIKEIHDLVEEVAYQAFAAKVTELGIKEDGITEEQSGQILCAIKSAAHKEMDKKDGYIQSRTKLPYEQVQEVIRNVGLIVHDRDTKLTDARYYTITDLTMALDDHNTMVKEILLKSWYKCPKFIDPHHTHLDEIKERASVANRQAFWDNYFPGKRQACNGTSKEFVDIIDVRNYLAKKEGSRLNFATIHNVYSFHDEDMDRKLIDLLNPDDQNALFQPREIKNLVRKCSQSCDNTLLKENMTLKQFLTKFYPECI